MSTENPNRLAVGYLATPSGNDGVALASAIFAAIADASATPSLPDGVAR